MSLIRKHGAVLQAWACLDLVMFKFSFIVLLLLLCHVWYRDACKCLHGLGICFWFYSNKLMMMMMMMMNSLLRLATCPCFHGVDLGIFRLCL